MTQPTFYHNGDGEYTALTGESPKGFPNLFVAFTGSVSALQETCLPLSALGDTVKIDELPEPWASAFEGIGIKMPEPEPKPEPETTKGIREDELLVHVALGLDPLTAVVAATDDVEEEEDYPDWHPVAIVVVGIILSFSFKLIMGY